MKKSYCSFYFPRCVVTGEEDVYVNIYDGSIEGESGENNEVAREGDITPGVCTSLCSLISNRCPSMPQIYK
jgi:hypothetical protein